MNIRRIISGLVAVALCAVPTRAATTFDDNVTPDAIFGTGNANGLFTVDRSGGVELGLRAKIPFSGVIHSNADGTYTYSLAELLTADPSQRWNFDWTVNTDWDGSTGLVIEDLTYLLQMDFDPSQGTNFLEFDPITPNVAPLNAPFFDHSIGDNSTANGAGVEAGDAATYAGLIAANNVAQQSWRHAFFPVHPTLAYDPTIDGTYDIVLSAFDDSQTLVASTSIQVIIGAGGCGDDILEFTLAAGSECVKPGETVTVELRQLDLLGDVRGFQAFAQYDDSLLTSNGPATLTTTPYGQPILNSISGGLIDLAAGIDDLGGQLPSSIDAVLATLTFTAGATEGPTFINFRTHLPPSRFTDPIGLEVVPCLIPSQTIVIDGSDPVISCPADVVVECDESTDPSNTGDATATDNLDPAPAITFVDGSTVGACADEQVITRTWTATDCAGNTDVCVQTISVVDTTDPVITCPSDVTVDCADSTAPAATGLPGHFQGFEDPGFTSGTSPDWNDFNSSLARVVSGTDSIPSSSGGFHAVIDSTSLPPSPNDFSGAFTRLGGYDSTFDSGFVTSLDVYIDLTDAAVVADTYGWDLSSAANNQSGTHLRDFIFHAASNPAGNVFIGGSNNTNFTRRNDLATINNFEITSTGWYTFESVFRDAGDGSLAVDLNLRDASGTLLWTETRNTPADVIATIVGGHRYMWFTFLEVDRLAIDNTSVGNANQATDNCDADPTVTFSDSFVPVSPGCASGTLDRTWTATDDCGNSTMCVQTITVVDSTDPVITCPADLTIDCTDSTAPTGPSWLVQNIVDNDDEPLGLGQGPGTGEPRSVRGLALSPDANFLYLGYNQHKQVRKIDLSVTDPADSCSVVAELYFDTLSGPEQAAYLGTYLPDGLDNPKAVATDDLGRVYVTRSSEIQVYDADLTGILFTITGFSTANGVHVARRDATSVYVYAADRGLPEVYRMVLADAAITGGGSATQASVLDSAFDGDGIVDVGLDSAGAATNDMRGLSSDGDGNVWVAENDGTLFQIIPAAANNTSTVLKRVLPGAFDVTIDGDRVLVSSSSRKVTVIDRTDISAILDTLDPFAVPLGTNIDKLEPGVGSSTGIDSVPGGALFLAIEGGSSMPQSGESLFSNVNCGGADPNPTADDDNDPVLQFAAGPVPGLATASDDCDGDPAVTFSDSFVPDSPGCAPGTLSRTWTATDACGNDASCVQQITIEDITAPSFTSVPADISVSNDAGMCEADVNPGLATADDDCDGAPMVSGVRSDGMALLDPYPATCDCSLIPGTLNTSQLSENAWFSDDSRADGTGTQSAGTNLISDTLTDDPEATASGLAAHDADILDQISFDAAPGTVPAGTHEGAVHLEIAPATGASGKSQISHRKDDGTGHAPGSVLDSSFFAEYSWMGDGLPALTASFKLGIKTSEFGSTGVSGRTGENVWDKVLIYEPGQGNGKTSDGTWQTETISFNSGKWWFFDRTAVASIQSTPMTLADMVTSGVAVGGGGKTVADVYALMTAPGAHITSIQFGVGSNNPGASVYVNQLGTNFYRSGSLTTFGCNDGTVITWTAEDCAGNSATAEQKVTVLDTEDPVISGLTVIGGNVDGSCEHTVTFSATVTDNCCIGTDGVAVAVSLLTGNATLGAPNITKVQTDGQTVTITGDVLVSDLTNCPATVEVTVDATDCCGNSAAQESDTADVEDMIDPVITCPADVAVNADAGLCTAVVDPGLATATDNCDAGPVITWTRSDGGLTLIDPYDQSDSPVTITWTATDACGNIDTCMQTVTVDGENEVAVTVELSPNIDTGNPLPDTLDRCITFELWDCPFDSGAPAVTVDAVVTFNVVAGAPNTAIGTATLEVPCGVYECITARDKLHTLRRTDETFGIVGTQYVADFTGDVSSGGDWLVGGNLNDDFFIDILDFGIFSLQFGSSFGTGDTTCATSAPHADISGDGLVTNIAEFSFIQQHFLESHEANCCGAALRGNAPQPVLEISVRELRQQGMAGLAVGDLNRDGWLNVDDIAAFANGVRPRLRPVLDLELDEEMVRPVKRLDTDE